jgi:hypothetical protein
MRSKLILTLVAGGVLGSLVVLMLIYLTDKSRNRASQGLQLVTNDSTKSDSKNQQILVYGDYMNLDSTDYLLFPLGMKSIENSENKGLRSKSSDEYVSDTYGGGYRNYKYNFYSLNFYNCNNIIFYNKKTEETHLLLQKPAIISQFYFPYYSDDYKGEKFWFLLMAIREYDTNADGFINKQDAEIVYVSNLSGTKIKPVTPDNTQLIDWFIDESSNTILLKVRNDSNKDKVFNYYDEVDILKTDISSPSIGKPIIGKEIKSSIKKILEKIK